MEKVILAYSGGINTTLAIHWLRQYRNLEVITFAANLGFGEYFESLGEMALSAGASSAHVENLRNRFVNHYVLPSFKAGARYGSGYLLSSALSRPLIVDRLVKLARESSAAYIAHGCTGKGNDQLRFEASIAALAPDIKIIAPVREWPYRSPEERLTYARRNNIRLPPPDKHKRSVDGNVWGISIEAPVLEDLATPPPGDLFFITKDPSKAPAAPLRLRIEFRKGEPLTLDGKAVDLPEMIESLNQIGGRYGVGRVDVVEDRAVGIKTREVYEIPGATILSAAHQALEDIVLTRNMRQFKESVSTRYGQLIYDGFWFSPLREALDAFVEVSQRLVTGAVTVEVSPGSCRVVGRESPFSLYNKALATYTAEDAFPHAAASGFAHFWSMESRLAATGRAARRESKEKKRQKQQQQKKKQDEV